MKPLFKKSLCLLAVTSLFAGSTVAITPTLALADGYDKRSDMGKGRRAGKRKTYKKAYRQGRRDQRQRSRHSSSQYSYGYSYPSRGYRNSYPSYGYSYGGPRYRFGYHGHGNSNLALGLGIVGAAAILTSGANKRARRRAEAEERQYQQGRAERDADLAYEQGRLDGQSTQTLANPNAEFGGNCLQTREYQTTIIVGGKEKEAYGTTCLKADGSWEMGAPKLALPNLVQ